MGLSYTVSEIMAIAAENRKISHPICILRPLLKGFLLELGIGARCQKTRMMRLPDRERSLMINSAVWDIIHQRTDGQTPGNSKKKQRLRIASRGKNGSSSTSSSLPSVEN